MLIAIFNYPCFLYLHLSKLLIFIFSSILEVILYVVKITQNQLWLNSLKKHQQHVLSVNLSCDKQCCRTAKQCCTRCFKQVAFTLRKLILTSATLWTVSLSDSLIWEVPVLGPPRESFTEGSKVVRPVSGRSLKVKASKDSIDTLECRSATRAEWFLGSVETKFSGVVLFGNISAKSRSSVKF